MNERDTEHRRRAWAALAARPSQHADAPADIDLIVALAERRLTPDDEERAWAHLANTPRAWAIWRQLREMPADAFVPAVDRTGVTPPPGLMARFRRWLTEGDGHWAAVGFASLTLAVVGTLWIVSGVRDPGAEPWAVSEAATAWVAQASDLASLREVSFDLPALRASSAGLRHSAGDGGEATLAFEHGFSAGRRHALKMVGRPIPNTVAPPAPACDSVSCVTAHDIGTRFGVWAMLTSLRCAAAHPLPASPGIADLQAGITALERESAMPFALPRPPANATDVELCTYSEQLQMRYAEVVRE